VSPPTHEADALAAPFRDRHVLITGGLGFIGARVARRLVEAGARVLVVDSLIPGSGARLDHLAGVEDRLRLNIADLRDPHSVPHLVSGQDYLFNLAAQTGHMDAMIAPLVDLDINCRAQLGLLEACRQHNPNVKIVFASTRQVYGRVDYLPVDERHPARPVDINGIHKLAAERYHLLYHEVHGLQACVLRLTNTVGPGMRVKDARQNFLGAWIRALVEGQPFEVWGGSQLRDITYVDDVVDALLLAAASPSANGATFNLGSGEPIRLAALADLLVRLNGSGRYVVRPYPAERKRIEIGDYYADFGLIRSTLGWAPRTPLADGLARTLAYYRRRLTRYL